MSLASPYLGLQMISPGDLNKDAIVNALIAAYDRRMGNTPACHVYHNATQSIGNNTSATALTYNSERYDTDNIHDPASNPTRLTCRTAGKYLIWSRYGWSPTTGGGIRRAHIKVNFAGTAKWVAVLDHVAHTNGTDSAYVTIATVEILAVGDYAEIYPVQSSGGSLSVLASTASADRIGCDAGMILVA